MKLYHRDKAKEYRRIMLDVLEVCPVVSEKILSRIWRTSWGMVTLWRSTSGICMAPNCSSFTACSFRHATPYQSRLLQSIVDRLEEAYRYDSGQAFTFETAEERQASRKEISESIRRQIEWSERRPFLSALLMKDYSAVGITTLLVMLIIASLILFVFGGKHPDLSF